MRWTIQEISETLFQELGGRVGLRSGYSSDALHSWKDLEWRIAQAVMIIHGMGPLWGAGLLGGMCGEKLPAWLRTFLVDQYSANTERVAILHKSFEILQKRFFEEGIAVVPFKGIVLSRKYYPEPGLRPMADIDIFVHADDRQIAFKCMEALDYEVIVIDEKGATFLLKNRVSDRYRNGWSKGEKKGTAPCGEGPHLPISVDVHFFISCGRLSSFSGVDLTADFAAACKNSSCALPDEIHFIYNALHVTKHIQSNSCRWIQLYDLWLMQAAPSLDREQVVERVKELAASPLVFAAISLAGKTFGRHEDGMDEKIAANCSGRLKRLGGSLQLSERSYCNPHGPSMFAELCWLSNFRDVKSLLGNFSRLHTTTLMKDAGVWTHPAPPLRRLLKKTGWRQSAGRQRMEWSVFTDIRHDAITFWK